MAIIKPDGGYNALPISYKRGNPIPLDITAVWYNLEDLKTYAKTGATAYVGQILTYVDNTNLNNIKSTAYVITNTSGDLKELTFTEDIGNISDIMQFKGIFNSLDDIEFEPELSDVVICDDKTYIYKDNQWVELSASIDFEELDQTYLNKSKGGDISGNLNLKNSSLELTKDSQGLISGNRSAIYTQSLNAGLYLSTKDLSEGSKATRLRLHSLSPNLSEQMLQTEFKKSLTLQLEEDINIAGFQNEYVIYGQHNTDLLKSAISDTFATKQEIGNITNIVNFRGVFESLEVVESPEKGDIVIVDTKEYIYDPEQETPWIELGDLAPAFDAIAALRTELTKYVDENATKTFNSFEELENAFKDLYKGQIVTVVNDYDAQAYIVFNEDCVMPLTGSGSLDTAEVISENTITDIISNDFESTPVTTKYSIKPGTINDIISGTYDGGESILDSEISAIINPKEE